VHIVLMVHSLAAGGAERVTSHLANHWVTLGRKVTLVTLGPRTDDFYLIDPRVHRVALGLVGESPNVAVAIRSNLQRVREMRRVLRQKRPDIVVAMMATVTVLAVIAATGLGIPVVVSERNHPPHIPLGRAWELLRRVSYGRADRVVMLTRKGLQWLEATVPGARGVVIANPVLYPLPATSPVLPVANVVQGNVKVVLAVGRLAPQKGFDILITAFAQAAHALPDWMLVIIGEGRDRQGLERQARELGVQDRVLLPGRAGNVGDWYSAASLFVMSSRFEGFPNTLAEAMAHGCAVISFDCDTGPSDIVRHGEDGALVVPTESASALSAAMAEVMADEGLRKRWAQRALEIRDRFSAERVFALWDAMFASIESSHPSRPGTTRSKHRG
jgi:glycosyltransferase involved in cell wall biosynthesis